MKNAWGKVFALSVVAQVDRHGIGTGYTGSRYAPSHQLTYGKALCQVTGTHEKGRRKDIEEGRKEPTLDPIGSTLIPKAAPTSPQGIL